MRSHLTELLAVFVLLLLGCTQEESTGREPSNSEAGSLVTFLAAANNTLTRGKAMSGILNENASFMVYATKEKRTTNNVEIFIPGDEVSYQRILSTGKEQYCWVWKTDHDYYWPQDNYYVSFYAVHPAEAPQISNILTSKQVSYTGTSLMPGNYDLMYAKIERTYRSDSEFTSILEGAGDNRAVELTFHHLLARIMFYGKLSKQFKDFGWTVETDGITIHNLNGAGAFDLDDTKPAITAAETSEATDYALTMNPARPTIDAISVKKDDDGNDIPLTSPTEITAVIPQNPIAWDPENEAITNTSGCYLTIKMRIIDADGKYQLGTANSYGTVYVPFQTNVHNITGAQIRWQPETTYKYTLEFGGGYDETGKPVIQPMGISTAIQPWESTTVSQEATHKRIE